jgi:ABC-type dipeptide/oligopeptide/nickel transport system permease subunit
VLEESKIGNGTIYKLSVGGIILFLLLMTFLPTPQDPQASAPARLAFPFVAGHLLGTDRDGRDELSLMMVGGRVLLLRLCILGLLLSGIGLVIRRRFRKRRGRPWPGASALVLAVSIALALSALCELALGLSNGARPVSLAGPVGWVLLGAQPPGGFVSWGVMLFNGIDVGAQAPWLAAFPALGLILVAAALVLLGSGMADVLRQRARR